MYVAPQHRAAVAADARRPACATWSRPPSRAATPSCSWSRRSPATRRRREDTAYLQALLDGSTVLDGLAIDTEMRWTLLTRAGHGRSVDAPRSRPSASGTTPRPAASGRPAPSPRLPHRPRRRPTRGGRRSTEDRPGQPDRRRGRHRLRPRARPAAARAVRGDLPRRAAGRSWTSRTPTPSPSRSSSCSTPQLLASRELADATQALAGRARRRPGRPAPAGGREPRRHHPRAGGPGAGRTPAADRRHHAKDPPSRRLRGSLCVRADRRAVSAGRPCGPAGGPSARPSGPRAAAGLPSGPASGTRQLGYSSSVPGWFCVRRSPTASVSATQSSRDGVQAR